MSVVHKLLFWVWNTFLVGQGAGGGRGHGCSVITSTGIASITTGSVDEYNQMCNISFVLVLLTYSFVAYFVDRINTNFITICSLNVLSLHYWKPRILMDWNWKFQFAWEVCRLCWWILINNNTTDCINYRVCCANPRWLKTNLSY